MPKDADKGDSSLSLLQVGLDPLGSDSLVLYHRVFRDAIHGISKSSTLENHPNLFVALIHEDSCTGLYWKKQCDQEQAWWSLPSCGLQNSHM